MSKRISPALSQRKINENQGVAAARESVQRLYAEIKQRLPFSLGKEKLFLENIPVRDTCFAFYF